LTALNIDFNQISDISPLSKLTNLTTLSLELVKVNDIKPLSRLTKLNSLDLNENISSVVFPPVATSVKTFYSVRNKISDIALLSKLTNLTFLNLSGSQITDIKPLSGLSKLANLNLSDNQISDIKPLSGLTNLKNLSLQSNQISDIKPLSGLSKLNFLFIVNNRISDISPLSGLTNLIELDIADNPIKNKICPIKSNSVCKFEPEPVQMVRFKIPTQITTTIHPTTQQTTPLLEYRLQKQGTEATLLQASLQMQQVKAEQAQLKKSGNAQQQRVIQAEIDRLSQQISNLFEPATLTNYQIIDAYPKVDNPLSFIAPYPVVSNKQQILWSIAIKFSTEGKKRFTELTKNIAGTGRALGIFVKGELISTPMVSAEFALEGITGGVSIIRGNFTAEQAKILADQLMNQPMFTIEPDRSLRLGYKCLHAKNYQCAINYYTQAIAFSPKNPDLYLQRARIYEELEQIPQAVADYERVIQVNSKKFQSVVLQPLLMHYLELGNKPRSITLVEKYFLASSSMTSPILQSEDSMLICAIHTYFKDYYQTIQHCNRALELNHENNLAAYFRGIAFELTGNLKQAKLDYEQVLKIDLQKNIPKLFRENSQYSPEINLLFQKYREQFLVTAYYVRGLAHYRLNNWQEAIADFNQVLKLDPNFAAAYRDRGLVYKVLGNLFAANQDFQKAAQRFKMQNNLLGMSSVLDLLLQKLPVEGRK